MLTLHLCVYTVVCWLKRRRVSTGLVIGPVCIALLYFILHSLDTGDYNCAETTIVSTLAAN